MAKFPCLSVLFPTEDDEQKSKQASDIIDFPKRTPLRLHGDRSQT